MRFRTTCPACASVFRLGADQLEAADGWVQCSVCGSAFDVRPSLLMEDGSSLATEPQVAETEPGTVAPAQPSAFPFTQHGPEEVRAIEQAARVASVAPVPGGIVQRETALDLPSIILIDPDIPVPDDFGPLPQIDSAPDSSVAPVPTAPVAPAARIEYAAPQAVSMPVVLSVPRRTKRWVWGLASGLLLLALLAQMSYFLRDHLVGLWPQARPAFEQACSVLGCTVSLPRNLEQLQIIGSDLQTETRSRLKLVLTLGNRADQPQAWPMLVLTLTDQRERPLARRSFAPSEYLEDSQRIAAGIPPRSEQALNLPLTIRDVSPMGFDLKLIY
ncbi:MAG TPA: zinc-ribbon and DUF3426 domain-containing protein [Thiobacillus sp.]|nr:MAG: hypothetical protein B7Y50_12565 [Hydrogenophilales bacterium 28-61-11]OYZ56192.1 MAG: hypothetical protein B7Y21_12470 [Hydrogenophilales bacterium 16-61-112]HQT31783.1 zinc-ribbon and DUF3426 domain-containing protein [Thiobacillus sp.]HQT71142.1 zinc-ribbon and DUF3426 domain-containing protein [Thiobacillus sp.]